MKLQSRLSVSRSFRKALIATIALLSVLPSAYGQEHKAIDQSVEADVTIGCLYPLTGPMGFFGRDADVALGMAVDQIEHLNQTLVNSGEPVPYPRLKVLLEDSKGKRHRSATLARQLVEEQGVDILCGVVYSSIALEISAYAERQKVLFIGGGHTSSRLTEVPVNPWYFMVNNDSRQSMRAGARYLKEIQTANPWTTLAYVGPDYDYGHQALDDLLEGLESLEVPFKLTDEYYPKLSEPDFSAYIEALLVSPPDIVVCNFFGDDFANFVRQAHQQGLLEVSQLANFDTGGGYSVMSALGDDMPPGVILSGHHHNNWPDTPVNREFVEEFYRRSGRYPNFMAQTSYSVVLAVAEAWRNAEVKDAEGVRQALEGLELSLPEDPQGFQSWIDPVSHQMMQVIAIGESLPNEDYPPATRMLGNWKIYMPELSR
ncbi:ABC transporter substrate-binding protein [Marinobacter sp. 1_MG-2023]|uniref:ABC transporter substrate-binding protein n=1 Tax=Marinobacter sp. 1_MG-2023 TaxID=3062627 RepID=UPI0026E1B2D2|nr:ABC transporter substrate-binding protein [Marinobacter sp. 1_MG-2023]MDO6824941.1 ABC transporter substrate-binding protein [Marinobacter sp. 1_MG-2023]